MVKKRSYEKRLHIIQEFLTTSQSYSELALRFGVPSSTIKWWVSQYRKHHQQSVAVIEVNTDTSGKKLSKVELKNQLLEQILELAKEHTGIDFKKKYGTRRS